MTRYVTITILCLLLAGCATQKPVAVKPSPNFKAVSAPMLPSAKMQSFALVSTLPKLNLPRTLTLACDSAAGADRYGWAWGTNATTITATNWTTKAQATITNLPHSGRLWFRVKAATGPYESAWCDPITFSTFATAWQMSATGACKIAVNITGPWTARTNYSETVTNGYSTGVRFLKGMVALTKFQVPIP
jgi:hypothetical protein